MCSERFFTAKRGEGSLMIFANLGLTAYARKEMSGKCRTEGGDNRCPNILCEIMATLATQHHRWVRT